MSNSWKVHRKKGTDLRDVWEDLKKMTVLLTYHSCGLRLISDGQGA